MNRLVLCLAAALVSGCATLPDAPEPPPVPVGPHAAGQPPGMRTFPQRPPGADAPGSWAAPVRERAPAPVPPSDLVMKVQILLDRANFSPGCIDGRMGGQTRTALLAWQKQERLPASAEIDAAVEARVAAAGDLFEEHVVTAEDVAALGSIPATWLEKSRLPALAHETVLELVAENYHTTQRAMRELNPTAAWPNPPAGTVLRVPRVGPAPKPVAARAEIHLLGRYVEVFDAAGRVVAHFPCSIARNVDKRPVGELRIVNAAEHPNYTFDPALFSEDPAAAAIGRRLLIPPGPNNPVGVAWLSLDRPGYGIHGTPHPEDIGKTESHGCFRLANWNARKLLGMVAIGLPVVVQE